MDVRAAAPADLPAVAAIVEAAYSHYIARIGRKPGPMLDDHGARIAAGQIFVLDADGAVRGLVVLVEQPGILLLDNLAVAPDAQGQGIGRRLLAFAEARARARGFGAIRLYTHERMTENIALYARAGYAETHRATEGGYPRVHMRKDLPG